VSGTRIKAELHSIRSIFHFDQKPNFASVERGLYVSLRHTQS
jgi:hypothetical protein